MKAATTVTKVCRILDQFKNRPSLGITDLTRSLQMLPSDVHRIVSSLHLYGYVEQDPETRRYHLGAGLLRQSLATLQRNVFQEKGRAVLVRLSARLDATTHLALLDNGRCEVFLADQVDHAALNIFESRLGSTTAIHPTALGKTIMAGMDAGTFQRALERCGLPRSTGKTITEMPALERELVLIRQRGYAHRLRGINRGNMLHRQSPPQLHRHGHWGNQRVHENQPLSCVESEPLSKRCEGRGRGSFHDARLRSGRRRPVSPCELIARS